MGLLRSHQQVPLAQKDDDKHDMFQIFGNAVGTNSDIISVHFDEGNSSNGLLNDLSGLRWHWFLLEKVLHTCDSAHRSIGTQSGLGFWHEWGT